MLFFPAQRPYWFISVLPHNPISFLYPYFPNSIPFLPKKYRNRSRNEIFFVRFRPFSSLLPRKDESGTGNFGTDRHRFPFELIMIYIISDLFPFQKKIKVSSSINFIVILTVFDFVSFINTGKSRADRHRFQYYDSDSDRFQLFSSRF